jgi:hypothetical protein
MAPNASDCLKHPFARRSTRLAILATALAIAYTAAFGKILATFAGFYSMEMWRQSMLEQRLIGYRYFLYALATALWVFVFLVHHSDTLNRHPFAFSRVQPRFAALILAVCGGVDVWLSFRLWDKYGRPCFDGYCVYSELIRTLLIHPTSTNANVLLSFARGYEHANSPVGPFLIGLISAVTRLPIDSSYALLSSLATLGILMITWTWLRQPESGMDWIRFAAFLLVLTHPALVRSFVFLQTDALATLCIVAVIVLGLVRFENPQRWQLPVGALLISAGLFTKLSFLPAVAMLPSMEVVRCCKRPRWGLGTVLQASFAFIIVPLLSFVAFQYFMGTHAAFARELHLRGYVDRNALFIAEVSLRTLMFFIPLILIGYKQFTTPEYLLGGCAVIYLVSLWLGRAPGWDRHYLPLVFPLVLLAPFGLRSLAQRCGSGVVWLYVLLSAALQYSITGFNIVQ